MSVVTLSAPGIPDAVLDGSAAARGMVLRGLSGWLGTPTAKVDLTERLAGDGAHDVQDAQILYSARTVTIEYRLLADTAHDREQVLDLQARLRMFVHRMVTVRVQDGEHDLSCTGYVDSIDTEQTAQNINWQYLTGQVVIVCPRPELLSSVVHGCQVQCANMEYGSGGLSYYPQPDFLATRWTGDPNNSPSVLFETLEGDEGLHYPLAYMLDDTDAAPSNTGVLTNDGSSRAYPVFRVYGPMPDGVDLEFPGTGLRLRCALPVYAGSPLILDSRTRTASVNGVDVSETLTARGFPTVPPQGSVGVLLRTIGDGWVDCEVCDTYI
ncbi:hypothetical protein [Bifidobacterium castoris]|uniref:Phage tail protein n=1 Tax=Bifidobacterium castoris TaxID=2306972 RepID=A0A430F821_9BIFI|nr:hypothetical protein [Bifidobacterium castoris]RSX48941.1 hypothetical protein D2E22_1079 [Bifidobacterium castoris]